MRCSCETCTAVRHAAPPPMDADHSLRQKVAQAICTSVIRGDVIGGTHTVWTDWQPEADAAIAAMREHALPPGKPAGGES